MTDAPRAGRPRASSRETLAEAACELFLEKGYEATSVADIAQRAGVSRASFFNYFGSKGDVVWSGLDERIGVFERALASGAEPEAAAEAMVEDFTPDALALAFMNAGAMSLDGELDREGAARAARIARVVADRHVAEGMAPLRAEVTGAVLGGSVLAAVRVWARQGPGTASLAAFVRDALALLNEH